MTTLGIPETKHRFMAGSATDDGNFSAVQLKPTERLLIEKTLVQMYPRLQRRNLIPWKWFQSPLLPELIISHNAAGLRRIVEIGCGDGVMANVLSLLFPDVEIIGIDTDREKIAYARSTIGYRRNLKFICANATVLAEIPCDRIIYNQCLSRMSNIYSFKKMVIKTSQWLVDEGDFIVKESPLALLKNVSMLKELFPKLREKQSLAACIRTMLCEIGYQNPMIYNSQGMLGFPTEIYYRATKGMFRTDLLGKSMNGEPASEWQDWGDTSNDSLVTFLFADAKSDFTRELV